MNGPITNLSKNQNDNLIKQFIEYKKPHGLYGDKLALITKINKNSIEVISKAEEVIKIETMNMDIIKDNDIDCRKYFKKGDVLVISLNEELNLYELSDIPRVNGGMVVLENDTGRVLAMVGGYDSSSSFNRATQALRQLGSSFKPFVYISALENGYSPVSRILDAPFVVDDHSKDGVWRPTNYGEKFYGLSTLRLGIEKSRNLMTIRLSDEIGLEKNC